MESARVILPTQITHVLTQLVPTVTIRNYAPLGSIAKKCRRKRVKSTQRLCAGLDNGQLSKARVTQRGCYFYLALTGPWVCTFYASNSYWEGRNAQFLHAHIIITTATPWRGIEKQIKYAKLPVPPRNIVRIKCREFTNYFDFNWWNMWRETYACFPFGKMSWWWWYYKALS